MYYEFKYLIPPRLYAKCKSWLQDQHGTSDPYPQGLVTSVYFDSLDGRCFSESAAGEQTKRKFRIRSYSLEKNSQLVLQVKEKNLNAVKKFSCPLRFGVIDQWPEFSQIDNHPIYALSQQYPVLSPLVRIRYDRSRFRIGADRVNLDENIVAVPMDGMRGTHSLDFHFPFSVLEIKTKDDDPRLPFMDLLSLQQMSFSKFYLGVECLRKNDSILNKYFQ